ncbi:MAG: ATP-binding cassette domain-containing protein [Clostridia bacterium]|nr:ATP-binding cassette domain-containing protein [Clostridia bacterium]
MIEMNHIAKAFDGKAVLTDFSLSLGDGITCLMAPSGRGKTTLLRILLGLETADAGQITGRPDRIAVLFQEDRLMDSLTVGLNLKLALGRAYAPREAEALLAALGMPGSLHLTVSTLSGGMKRRAALARALLYPAPLLVLDEPFQGLDEDTRRLAIDAVRHSARGRTALVVTHDPEDVGLLGGRLIHLQEE